MTLSSRPRSVVAALALASPLIVLAGCGHGAATVMPAPVAASPAGATTPSLQVRAIRGADRPFAGTYAVSDSSNTAAVVRIWYASGSYRVDVAEGNATAALFGSRSGSVACPEQKGRAAMCFAVAGPGKPVPPAYDAGIERVFTRDLPALAHPGSGVTVRQASTPAAAGPGTACWAVTTRSTSVDSGTYCLEADGAPWQLRFTSGTLTLTSRGGTPTVAQLRPPAKPQPLPS